MYACMLRDEQQLALVQSNVVTNDRVEKGQKAQFVERQVILDTSQRKKIHRFTSSWNFLLETFWS